MLQTSEKKNNTWLDTTGHLAWSRNLTIQRNNICSIQNETQNSPWFWDTNISPCLDWKNILNDNYNKNKNLPNSGFFHSGGPLRENQMRWKGRQVFRSYQIIKNTLELEVDGDTIWRWCAWNSLYCLARVLGDLEDEWGSSRLQHCWDQPEYCEESWRSIHWWYYRSHPDYST